MINTYHNAIRDLISLVAYRTYDKVKPILTVRTS